jgi:shikimate dehydrogenase
MTDPVRRRAAVCGSPIAHSLSPVLHRAAYAELGLTGWSYEAIRCEQDGLAGLLDSMGPEWAGLSLTMPLKRVALELADDVAPLAQAVGAANTLVLRAGVRRAENTDVAGLVGALSAAGVTSVRHGVILGAGGTAQAALAALAELGERTPTAVVRDVARSTELQQAAIRLDVELRVVPGLLDSDLPPADVVISTLPANAGDAVRWASGHPPAVVFDAVYAPWPTELAQRGAAEGAQIISGLDMLLHQAVEQVRLFTGRPGPLEAMRAALEHAVRSR